VVEARIEVRLRPRSRAEELEGFEAGVLQARVTAPPVDGKANRALCRLIAKRLRLAPSRVTVIRGEKAPRKQIRVEGLDEVTVRERLEDGDGR
jgi:uncharacterized protein (TIGR00251 family)